MATVTDTDQEKITIQEAYLRYRIPIATLRYWLDKGRLTRGQYDNKGRVVLDVAELESRYQEWKMRGERP